MGGKFCYHFWTSVHLFCPRYTCDHSLCCGPDGSTAALGRAQKTPRGQPGRRRQGHVRHFEFAIS
jgi:hypothetical protein